MDERILVKPRNGFRVKDPVTFELIKETGKRVPKSAYWLRRLLAGDVEIVEESNGAQPINNPED